MINYKKSLLLKYEGHYKSSLITNEQIFNAWGYILYKVHAYPV